MFLPIRELDQTVIFRTFDQWESNYDSGNEKKHNWWRTVTKANKETPMTVFPEMIAE